MRKALSLILATLLLTLCACSALADATLLSTGSGGKTCLAATPDGTRLLLCEVMGGKQLELSVLDTATKQSRPLYFEHSDVLQMMAEMFLLRQKIEPEDARAIIEKQGGAAAFVMRNCWNSYPRMVGASDNMLLLYSPALDYVRVNVDTGEALLLNASLAAMGQDGSVLLASREDGALYMLSPDAALPAPLPKAGLSQPIPAMTLLSDGSFWRAEQTMLKGDFERNGKKALVSMLAFVRCGADGAELERIDAGRVVVGRGIDALYYYEEAGVGFAFSNAAMCEPLYVFRTGKATASVLTVKDPEKMMLAEAEIAVALDEFGVPVSESRKIYLFGVAADGAVLALDFTSGYLLWLDPVTLEAAVAATAEQLEAVFNSQSAQFSPVMLTNNGWNGGELICGSGVPTGYALRLQR